ncbi:MAG: response regulator transcription factor [Chitinophagales bacterium]|nr:response regulator transcription factor [Chitinophagales bacterium]
MKILVIEDEPKVASFIRQGLEEQNYDVDVAYDGQTGKRLATSKNYDLILMDVIIPYTNGVELCKELRANHIDSAVLMLTALGTTEDKLTGFDAGADDYLVKPFAFSELLARVKALTKRARGGLGGSNSLKVADLELNLDQRNVRRGGKTIELTAKEFALLEFFIRNKGKVLSRADIARKVWDINFDTGTNVVDVYVNFLRKKIDRDFPTKLIHTHIGVGYILKDE